MAHDALDPGPGNTYPHFPRTASGAPDWGRWAPDATWVSGRLLTTQRDPVTGRSLVLDLAPRTPSGELITVPTLP